MKNITVLILCVFTMFASIPVVDAAHHRGPDGKLKVLYHIDSSDINVAKYAMALINKHIEAEGGPDKIDLVVVVHGPADLPPEYEQFKSRKYQVVAAGSGDPVCKPPSGFPQVPGTQCFAANSLGV